MHKAALISALLGAALSSAPAFAYRAPEREGVETVKFTLVVRDQQETTLPDILAAEADVDYAKRFIRLKLTKRFCHASGCPLSVEAPVVSETSLYALPFNSQEFKQESYACTNTIRAGAAVDSVNLVPQPTVVLCDRRGSLSNSNRLGDTQLTVTMTSPNFGVEVVTLYGPALKARVDLPIAD